MDYMELQRRAFEAQFGSLEELGYSDKTKEEKEPDDEFGGFSSDSSNSESLESDGSDAESVVSSDSSDSPPAPKVITLSDSVDPPPSSSKKDRKLLRLGRAPTLAELERKEAELSKLTKKQRAQGAKEDEENLENDLKLQRLLAESHILANQLEYLGADVTLKTIDYDDPTGTARRKVLTHRIRTLAATNSSTGGLPKKLQKMPMNLRKAHIKAREDRVAQYEREAKEAGIVLSKTKNGEVRDLDFGKGSTFVADRLGTGVRASKKRRERGLKINAVGKSTRNGLVISQRDIDRINGPVGRGKSLRGGRGGRGGRGRGHH